MQNGGLRGIGEDILPNAIMQDDGCTALHEAASMGDEKTLVALLNRGVDRNAKETKYGNTALHEAAWRGFSRSVKLLCSLPPVIPNNVRNSRLKLSPSNQNTQNALHSTLLGVRNAGGFSALHLAAQNGHNQTCREILLAGANPDVQNNYGDTPIHTACRYGHAGATRILISAKSDLNRTNLNGDTPLHIACAMGRRKLTKILLTSGAIIDIKNSQDETPKDIAIRKKLTEILEILNTPVHREKIKIHSNNNTEKVGLNKNEKSSSEVHPIKWSPYGCHYFPDPKTFPSPKIETLPKEPLNKGEQYYVDLAGNIRKGPVGVGNTCYCGPFFRHIEDRISKNRKSITQYVHKAAQRLDNKVQALALKTDDQIEQLTRSMLADRIRCEGRRLHLEHWLKRGEPLRVTTGGYCHIKSKKNYDNTNTLRKSKSLELLGANNSESMTDDMTTQLCNAKSFEILDDSQITVHQHADDFENKNITNNSATDTNGNSKLILKELRLSDNLPVTKRLEELLIKTNKIFEMEKIGKLKREKEGELIDHETTQNKLRKPTKKLHNKSLFQIPDDKTLINKLKRKSLLYSTKQNNPNLIEEQMKKITESLTGVQIEEYYSKNQTESCKSNNSTKDCFITQKEHDHRTDQEQEKSSILSSSSKKNHPSLDYLNSVRSVISNEFPNYKLSSGKSGKQEDNIEENFNNLMSALRRDFLTTKQVISSTVHGIESTDEMHNNIDDQTDSDASDYYDDEIKADITQEPTSINTSFFQNESFDDTKSSSNNTTLKSVRHITRSSSSENASKQLVEKINNPTELNELKSFILNQSVWRSQALKQSQQIINDKHVEESNQAFEDELKFSRMYGGVNSVVQKFEIKNSEIKPLKLPYPPIKETKVKSLIASIQGQSNVDSVPNTINVHKKCEDPTISCGKNRFSLENNYNYYCGDYIQCNIPPLEPNQMLLMTTKNSIPKDAYFHDLPNKNNSYPNSDKLLHKQMINHSSINPIPSHFGRRTRNTLHYVQQDYTMQDKLSTENYQNKTGKFETLNHLNYERIPPTHPLRISLTPEQIQFDRDLSNDSGFSTKMGGSSHDPSPCLFSHSEYASPDELSSNLLSKSKLKENSSNNESGVLQFFVGNASSLV